MTTERKVVLYISMSLDGYIATKDDGLEFLSIVEKPARTMVIWTLFNL